MGLSAEPAGWSSAALIALTEGAEPRMPGPALNWWFRDCQYSTVMRRFLAACRVVGLVFPPHWAHHPSSSAFHS
jgi:hypothetical protein